MLSHWDLGALPVTAAGVTLTDAEAETDAQEEEMTEFISPTFFHMKVISMLVL